MLRQLNLSHIILVESAKIAFQEGFNVLSGETGAGKSAIMEALLQIGGARTDSQLLRHGAEKGFVEAAFEIEHLPQIKNLLEASGIDHHEGDELLIRKEIGSNGKSRAFINNQLAHLSLLKKIGEELFQIVGQHANQKLFSPAYHLELVDIYGRITPTASRFKSVWEEENKLKKNLHELILGEQKRLREIERCQRELEELEKGTLKEGEEELLFSEYVKLSNREELEKLSNALSSLLSDQTLKGLKDAEKHCDSLIKLDPSQEDLRKTLASLRLELEEVVYSLRRAYGQLERDPERAHLVNERLKEINELKRKYGATVFEALTYQESLKTTLEHLNNAEETIEKLEKQVLELSKESDGLAYELTQKRKEAAKSLELEIIKEIRSLNMPKACFFIEIGQEERSKTGNDRIEFFFAPNAGEKKVPIKDCASGGELSRLLLALETILSKKGAIPTLVFDEIDANIGGQTAALIGEKLKELGSRHQVLCITHFPQVAKCAEHHIQISKREKEGRTISEMAVLDKKGKAKELLRMEGK